MTPAQVLEQALGVADQGYPVFPCTMDRNGKKRPTCKRGFKDAACDPGQIRELWEEHTGELVGVATGHASGILAIDLDTAKHPEAIDWFDANHNRMPITQTHMTQSGGIHLLYRWVEGLGSTAGKICKGIDSRGNNGFIVWWPSANFPIYNEWEIAECPAFILEVLRDKPRRTVSPRRPLRHQPQPVVDAAIKGILRKVANAPHGIKTNTLFWGSCRMGQRVAAKQIPDDLAFDLLAEAADDAGWPEREALKHIERGLRIGAGGA
jgi:hypothetical protein